MVTGFNSFLGNSQNLHYLRHDFGHAVVWISAKSGFDEDFRSADFQESAGCPNKVKLL